MIITEVIKVMRETRLWCPLLLLLFTTTADACMRVNPPTPGMPATPCKTCAKNLITIMKVSETAQDMDSDTTVTTGACAVRTFTCKGSQASIEIFTKDGSQGTIDDGGTGTATFAVTCNAAGTAWEAMGLTVTGVECAAVPPCRLCGLTNIEKTMNGAGSKAFADDQLMYPPAATGCVQRVLTCTGTMANIAVSTAAGPLKNVGDMGTGTSTYTVTCNAAGQWVDGGQTITAVECSETVANPCSMCNPALIDLMYNPDKPESSQMDSSVPGMNAAGCLTRAYTCTAAVNPTIEINNGAVKVPDAQDGMTDGKVVVVATCNAAGTAWESNGVAVTAVECTVPCQKCTDADVTLTTMAASGMFTSTAAMIDRTGDCATWNIKCVPLPPMGNIKPTLDINNGGGSWDDANDGKVDEVANFPMTCNADGTSWAFMMAPVTSLDCSAAFGP